MRGRGNGALAAQRLAGMAGRGGDCLEFAAEWLAAVVEETGDRIGHALAYRQCRRARTAAAEYVGDSGRESRWSR
ncbi:hypothetical protein AB0C38_43550 [Amycolatopsis sp. NPDC048633]|uniref:hypothetical protein n=1 Tax=Amycolatopsis sp. NPDC048633 TaxID=3157095 RepID=UPI0033F1C769